MSGPTGGGHCKLGGRELSLDSVAMFSVQYDVSCL